MEKTKPLRRVVTGQDERGWSWVRWDGPAPNVHEASSRVGRSHTDLWAWDRMPAPLTDDRGAAGRRRTSRPARPGFASAYLWSTAGNPAPVALDGGAAMDAIEPPPGGTLCRVLTIPPDDGWRSSVGSREVAAWFAGTCAPGAGAYDPGGPHPYLQQTAALEFAIVLAGTVTLMLDTAELDLAAGDVVVQRGSRHAWGNRGGDPAVVALSSHTGAYGAGAR